MPAVPLSEFSLRVSGADGESLDPREVEEITADLRAALAEAGVTRIDQPPGESAPDGARSVEFMAVCSLLITAVQTAEVLAKVVQVVRASVARAAAHRRALRLTVAGVDVDLGREGDVSSVVTTLLALPARGGPAGVRKALIIANARYDDPALAQLRAPAHDSDALARVLGDPSVGGFEVELLTDADERTIRRRIAALFAGRDRDDVVLLHFSCHGIKDTRGRLHLAARDTDMSTLGATSVPASFVNDQLSQSQSQRVVLILDCCYSGAFARDTVARAATSVHVAEEFTTGNGRIVLTASSATEYAFEEGDLKRSEGQPSVFTAALVSGLASGEADLDHDGDISIDELYDYTYRHVRARTPDQTPMKWSFGMEGSLSVARSRRPAALPATILEDLTNDRPILRAAGVAALERLLLTARPAQREAAIAALVNVREHDDSSQIRTAAGRALAGSGASTGTFTATGTDAAPPPRPAAPPPSAPPPSAPPTPLPPAPPTPLPPAPPTPTPQAPPQPPAPQAPPPQPAPPPQAPPPPPTEAPAPQPRPEPPQVVPAPPQVAPPPPQVAPPPVPQPSVPQAPVPHVAVPQVVPAPQPVPQPSVPQAPVPHVAVPQVAVPRVAVGAEALPKPPAATVAMVLSIVSLVTALCYVGFIPAIVALVFVRKATNAINAAPAAFGGQKTVARARVIARIAIAINAAMFIVVIAAALANAGG